MIRPSSDGCIHVTVQGHHDMTEDQFFGYEPDEDEEYAT
jgi:hypothetical protein